MSNLPPAQANLNTHAQEARYTNATGIAHACRSQAELSIFLLHIVRDFREGAHIHQTSKQAFPEDDNAYNVVAGDEVEHRVQSEERKVGDLEK